jgi:hypothetical protein
MLRAMLRATLHPNISGPPPSSHLLRPCCDYIAAMLRPGLRATSNTRSSPPPSPRHKSQHHMSATSKLNIRNIKIQCLQRPATRVCNIETQHLQHRKMDVCKIHHHDPSSSSSLLHLDTTPNSHVCSIKTQHPQHRKLMFETSKTCRNSHAKSRLN